MTAHAPDAAAAGSAAPRAADDSDAAVPADRASGADDGCGCSVPGAPRRNIPAWLLVSALASFVRARARRRS